MYLRNRQLYCPAIYNGTCKLIIVMCRAVFKITDSNCSLFRRANILSWYKHWTWTRVWPPLVKLLILPTLLQWQSLSYHIIFTIKSIVFKFFFLNPAIDDVQINLFKHHLLTFIFMVYSFHRWVLQTIPSPFSLLRYYIRIEIFCDSDA